MQNVWGRPRGGYRLPVPPSKPALSRLSPRLRERGDARAPNAAGNQLGENKQEPRRGSGVRRGTARAGGG